MKKIGNWRWMLLFIMICVLSSASTAFAEINATHVYHNHMPNFWAYYDTDNYGSTLVGAPIRYTYDGDVINLKLNPPAGYTYYLPNGTIMPHDDLVSYYSHHAKTGAYLDWPWRTTDNMIPYHPLAQKHVTMSGSVVNNVNNLIYHQNVAGYTNPNWGQPWTTTYNTRTTTNGFKALDLIHFTGHHTMGPLVGNDYFLKDMIYHNVTLSQDYFLGNSYQSSKGFFPTELGFSERLIPALKKMGIEWSVLGNVHYSRTLIDYPLLNDPGKDCLISPPNRADLQNSSDLGRWVERQMFNEAQVTYNKFPFASTPHYVKYVDPETGEELKIAGIPVEQAASWEEGYQGSVTGDFLKEFESLTDPDHPQFFVIAHDGDNSSGRAGDEGTWNNAANVTYQNGITGMGVDEYLLQHPIDPADVVHVQDGSWIDTRDSSSDPQWHHWRLPFGIWKGQFADFNQVTGTNFAPKKNLDGAEEGMTVSFEYGYHYLERNFALLQAALNFAKTAEQIWLHDHPNYWQPATAKDLQITHPGNQLNPYMISFPVKGDSNNDYAGGANPAELGWYFLLPAMDSGFGYYDENQDDCVKPTLAMNQSLYFTKPYVAQNLGKDQTGPSVWWPQRWPYNPGSANCDKSEGWTKHYFDNTFAIYTYAYDVSGLQDIKVKIRVHNNVTWANRQTNWIDSKDNTFRVYDPAALQAQGIANIDASKVTNWIEYPMQVRDLSQEINGVGWQPVTKAVFAVVPAQEIGNLYFTYISDYRDQMIDYYIEAVDSRGNVTKTDIQTVYVGSGRYSQNTDGKIVEDPNGAIIGTYPFVTDLPMIPDTEAPTVPSNLAATSISGTTVALTWTAATDNVRVSGYDVYRNGSKAGSTANTGYTDTGLTPSTTYTYTVKAYDGAGNRSPASNSLNATTTQVTNNWATIYYKRGFAMPYFHYCPSGGAWTPVPGVRMEDSEIAGYSKITVDLGEATGVEAVFNDGAGTWDNNGGQNYKFATGTSTFDHGVITLGAPAEDTEIPTTPTNVHVTSSTTTSITLSWTASTDNVGVSGYEVYRNGNKAGTSAMTTYTDSGLTSSTLYSYTVKAYDAAGNISLPSTAVSGSTSAGNTATIYYKRGFATPYFHYCPYGGTWTPVPGVPMQESEVAGYSKITVELGASLGVEAVFNNGSGIWDNNGGANYTFPHGTSTFINGQITAGAPTIDAQAPSVPANAKIDSVTTNTVTLSWSPSTDNAGVSGYEVYRNGSKVGTTASLTFTDSGLASATTYSYSIAAFDAAGNISAACATLSATTNAGNTAIIYYKRGFATPYFHYCLTGGTWTPVPGIQMQNSEVAGYSKITIELGSATGLEGVFNDGNGNWDNNGGQNYDFPSGICTFENGVIYPGVPQ